MLKEFISGSGLKVSGFGHQTFKHCYLWHFIYFLVVFSSEQHSRKQNRYFWWKSVYFRFLQTGCAHKRYLYDFACLNNYCLGRMLDIKRTRERDVAQR